MPKYLFLLGIDHGYIIYIFNSKAEGKITVLDLLEDGTLVSNVEIFQRVFYAIFSPSFFPSFLPSSLSFYLLLHDKKILQLNSLYLVQDVIPL